MLSGIISAIIALKELATLVKDLFGLYRKARKEKWLKDGRELVKNINAIKTDTDRRKLAKRLVRHTRNLKRG